MDETTTTNFSTEIREKNENKLGERRTFVVNNSKWIKEKNTIAKTTKHATLKAFIIPPR